MPNRRQFLTTTAGAGLLGYLPCPTMLPSGTPVTMAELAVTPDIVRLNADIEPIVRLIEQTPRKKCFDMISQQLQQGLPYRQFLAALYLAGIRNVNPQPPGFKFHCVFVIHSAHQVSLETPVKDRLLPLFWALDNFKASQQRDVEEGDFKLKPVHEQKTLSSGDVAWKEFHDAMDQWDEAKADRAIVNLVRHCSAHQMIEQLWQYGARDYRNIGHKAIFVANTWRTLQTIGWHHAEPALRSLVLGLLDFGKSLRVNDYAFEDQSFLANVELVDRNILQLPSNWTTHRNAVEVTKMLLEIIRSGKTADACSTALRELQSQRTGAPEIWDAVHLAAGELMMQQQGIYGIHTVTSVNALRYAYQTAADLKTRMLMLLQAIGWMCQFRKFMSGKRQGLKKLKITELEPVETPQRSRDALDDIFALVATNAPQAAAKAMTYAGRHPQLTSFSRFAQQLILRKATDAHDYKYAVSIFEDYRQVSSPWRPHMLATSTFHLRGSTLPDSPIMNRAMEAIRSL